MPAPKSTTPYSHLPSPGLSSYQLSPFDLVLLLVLSNAVQNSMNAGDNSLVSLNYVVGLTTYRNKKLEAIVKDIRKCLFIRANCLRR